MFFSRRAERFFARKKEDVKEIFTPSNRSLLRNAFRSAPNFISLLICTTQFERFFAQSDLQIRLKWHNWYSWPTHKTQQSSSTRANHAKTVVGLFCQSWLFWPRFSSMSRQCLCRLLFAVCRWCIWQANSRPLKLPAKKVRNFLGLEILNYSVLENNEYLVDFSAVGVTFSEAENTTVIPSGI